MFQCDSPDADPAFLGKIYQSMGPLAVDQSIRQALQLCWMVLPEGRKTVDVLETEIRRLVDRAIKDFKDDAKAFGPNPGAPAN